MTVASGATAETLVRVLVALPMAAVLLWSGLEKLRDPGPILATVGRLGPTGRRARVAVVLLALAEVGTGVALLFRPDAPWTHAALVALALLFAAVGLVALLRRERIPCGCLGSAGGGTLGRAQLLALPAWMAAVVVLRLGLPRPVALADGALAFAGAAVLLAGARGAAVARAGLRAAGDRRSASRMIAWLP